nr:polysaccharide biosynthesis C-terminal domain-containing protein [Butyrivibrio sp.]
LTGIRAIALLYVTPSLMMLLDECVYIFYTGKKHPDVDFYTNYGMYFAKAIIPTFLFTFLCCVPFIKSWNRVMARIERDELEGAAERFKSLFRRSAMLIIPVMIFVFILAETLQTAIFGKGTKLSIGMAQLSSIMITLLAVAVFISWLMNHMGKSLVVVVNLGILWALHVAGLVLFMMVLDLGVYGMLLACILSLIAYDAVTLFMVGKLLKIQRSFFKVCLSPLIASALSGLLVYLINLLLVNLIGEILTLIICLVAFYGVYLLIMVFFMAIRPQELSKLPLGFLFNGFSRE